MNREVEVLIFDIAGTRYGADVTQVSRISRHGLVKPIATRLGVPTTGKKLLVFHSSTTEERGLPVDSVEGVRRINSQQLRRLPLAASAPPVYAGAWLDGDHAVLLLDMSQLVSFAERKNA